MRPMANTVAALVERVRATERRGQRRVVALAGPPASGKSTLAEGLCAALIAAGHAAQTVPMDGFHLDNRILEQDGTLARKGAPETFDAGGFLRLVSQLSDTPELVFPLFDRSRDIAIAGAGRLEDNCETVIVEGNYLLYDAPVWCELRSFWDLSVQLDVPEDALRNRLVARWRAAGLSQDEAVTRAEGNDMRNAALVAKASLEADLIV